ncbi:peptidoglycan-binding protein [Alicyclobacillus kakegawensis]|uniref:peptidoglycan-binding protein n=1 Tax=Alicyclobacillus kakegawensis TaxID=392012 RepID=UPI00082B8301|nr:peptidoglycan-binding protein [Alicyclobacillus kakegawensis]
MEAWQGKMVWVWEVSESSGGNIQAIIARAQSARLAGLIVKAHDGRDFWSQFSSSLVHQLHGAGLAVGAWGYCYGAHPDEEAANAHRALSLGADFYVADVEAEFERSGMADAATRLMAAIRQRAGGKPIGYSTFGLPKYHPDFPFSSFNRHADFTMPQVYWGDFRLPPRTAVAQSLAYYRAYQIPVAPVGQAYGSVTPGQLQSFMDACKNQPGYSFWDYQSATPAMWSVISGGPAPTQKGGTSMLERGSQGQAVKLLQEELNLVLHAHLAVDGVYGPKTEAAVKSFQQQHHLTVDGVAGVMTLTTLGKALYQLPNPDTVPKLREALELLQKAEKMLQGVS